MRVVTTGADIKGDASGSRMSGLLALTLLFPGSPAFGQAALARVDELGPAATSVERGGKELVIKLPPAEVPAGGMVLTPVYRFSVPFDIALHGFGVEVVGDSGLVVSRDYLHHVSVTDPTRRSLMLPLTLPVFGASKESPSPRVPAYLFGFPLPRGERYLISAMLVNPGQRARRIQVRVRLSFLRPGRVFPLFRAYPFTIDVMYPLGGAGGRHDFDLPPGRSRRQWEGSPAISGSILGLGGHAHDYATQLSLVDVTTGDTLWRQRPVLDSVGRIVRVPVTFLYRWYRLGVRLEAAHVYRVSVEYDNPTGTTIPFGGMGSIAGLIVPDRGAPWPPVDLSDPTFRTNLGHLLDNLGGAATNMHGHDRH